MTDQASVENEDFWNAVSEDDEQNTDQASSESESEDAKPDEGEPSKEATPSPTLKVVKDGKRWKFKGEPANFSKVKQAAAKLLNEKRMDSKSIKKHADRLIAALTGRGVSAEEARQTWKALYDETVKNEQIAKKGKDTKEAKKKFASFKQHLGTEEKSPCNLNSPSVFGSKALERQSSKRKAEEEEEEEEPQVEEKKSPKRSRGDPFIMLSQSIKNLKEAGVTVTVKSITKAPIEPFKPVEVQGIDGGPTFELLYAENCLSANGFKVDYEIAFSV